MKKVLLAAGLLLVVSVSSAFAFSGGNMGYDDNYGTGKTPATATLAIDYYAAIVTQPTDWSVEWNPASLTDASGSMDVTGDGATGTKTMTYKANYPAGLSATIVPTAGPYGSPTFWGPTLDYTLDWDAALTSPVTGTKAGAATATLGDGQYGVGVKSTSLTLVWQDLSLGMMPGVYTGDVRITIGTTTGHSFP